MGSQGGPGPGPGLGLGLGLGLGSGSGPGSEPLAWNMGSQLGLESEPLAWQMGSQLGAGPEPRPEQLAWQMGSQWGPGPLAFGTSHIGLPEPAALSVGTCLAGGWRGPGPLQGLPGQHRPRPLRERMCQGPGLVLGPIPARTCWIGCEVQRVLSRLLAWAVRRKGLSDAVACSCWMSRDGPGPGQVEPE